MTVINEMELEKYGTKKPKKNFNKVHNDNDNGRYILVSKDHQVHTRGELCFGRDFSGDYTR